MNTLWLFPIEYNSGALRTMGRMSDIGMALMGFTDSQKSVGYVHTHKNRVSDESEIHEITPAVGVANLGYQ